MDDQNTNAWKRKAELRMRRIEDLESESRRLRKELEEANLKFEVLEKERDTYKLGFEELRDYVNQLDPPPTEVDQPSDVILPFDEQ